MASVWNSCVSTMMRVNNQAPIKRKAPPRAANGKTVPLHHRIDHDVIRRVVALYKKGKTPKEISEITKVGYSQVATIVYNARDGKLDGHVDLQ